MSEEFDILGFDPKQLETFSKTKNLNKEEQQIIDEKYKLPNGEYFTYKMLIDLCMYSDFIEDLYAKYECINLRELSAKLL